MKHKDELIAKINEILSEFHENTGIIITDIAVGWHHHFEGPGNFYSIIRSISVKAE